MSIVGTVLKKFFIYEVTIEPFTGQDDMNKPTYGTAVTYKAKIERQERMIRGDESRTIRSRRLIYLYTTEETISTRDRLTLPAGFEPLQPKINDVRIVHDHRGIHHVVLET